MTTSTTVRSTVKNIITQIETLASEANTRLSNGTGVLDVVNELVKNSLTLTFAVGELYALETVALAAAKTSKPRNTANYHKVRDNRTGKFVRAVRP